MEYKPKIGDLVKGRYSGVVGIVIKIEYNYFLKNTKYCNVLIGDKLIYIPCKNLKRIENK